MGKNKKKVENKQPSYKASPEDLTVLRAKLDSFNKQYADRFDVKLTLEMIDKVLDRGDQDRVNRFLYVARSGKVKNEEYALDLDLLPKKHPLRNEK